MRHGKKQRRAGCDPLTLPGLTAGKCDRSCCESSSSHDQLMGVKGRGTICNTNLRGEEVGDLRLLPRQKFSEPRRTSVSPRLASPGVVNPVTPSSCATLPLSTPHHTTPHRQLTAHFPSTLVLGSSTSGSEQLREVARHAGSKLFVLGRRRRWRDKDVVHGEEDSPHRAPCSQQRE